MHRILDIYAKNCYFKFFQFLLEFMVFKNFSSFQTISKTESVFGEKSNENKKANTTVLPIYKNV